MGAKDDLWAIIMIVLSLVGIVFATWEWIRPALIYLMIGILGIITLSSFITVSSEYAYPVVYLFCLAFILVMMRFSSALINTTEGNVLKAKWDSRARKIFYPTIRFINRRVLGEKSSRYRKAMPR